MRNPKMRIAIAMLAAFLSCAGVTAAAGASPTMTVSAATMTEITEKITLTEDITIEGNAAISADVDLNGHTLTVTGSLYQTKGTLNMPKGSILNITEDYWHQAGLLAVADSTLNIGGSYELHVATGEAGSGEFRISGGDTVFEIGGNMVIDSTIGRSYYQSAGTIRIGGDLTVYSPSGGKGLEPENGVTFDFTGKKQHKIYFDSTGHSHLSNVSASPESSLLLTGNTCGFTLASDLMLVDGSVISGTRDLTLNGHTLHVGGDFYQAGGLRVNADGSKLSVSGDYWHQCGLLTMADGAVTVAGNYELHTADGVAGNGEFRMGGESGSTFQIDGNMVIDTTVGRSYYHSSGIIKIGGNLTVYNPSGGKGLEPSKDVTVHFNGKKKHEIYFSTADHSYLTNVSSDAESTLLLTGNTTGFTLASDLTFEGGSRVCGSNALKLNGHSLKVNGDFTQEGALQVDVSEGSTLHITGDYWQQHGLMTMSNASVKVDGNYELHVADGTAGSGEFRLGGEEGSVFEIGGNMVIDTTIGRSYYQSAGTIRIGGDLAVYNPSGGKGLEPDVNVTTEFTGTRLHKVYFDSYNHSYLSNVAVEAGGKLFLGGQTTGFTLVSDAVFADGSRINGNTSLKLNGHTLTVAGTFYQNNSNVEINGGSRMRVAENYWQQTGTLSIDSGTLNIAGDYELHPEHGTAGHGELRMGGDAALIIGGDAVIDTVIGRSYYQGSGVIAISGDLTVYQPSGGRGLECASALPVEFRGAKEHKVNFDGVNSYFSALRVGVGDTVTFAGDLDGIARSADASLTVQDAALADVSGVSLTGKSAGEGTLTFNNGSSKKEIKLYVGASDTEDPYLGVTVKPEQVSNLRGDINGDGMFSISDAVLLARWLSADETAAVAVWKNGDMNEDGVLTAADLTAMKRELCGYYAEAKVIVTNFNTSAVSNHPTAKSTFTVEKECKVFSILTYHWNDGKGKTLGTIGLLEDGVSIGTWSVSGTKGQNGADDCNWWAYPHDLILKPGHTYTVVDSDPESWSYNGGSKGAGFFEITGTYTE